MCPASPFAPDSILSLLLITGGSWINSCSPTRWDGNKISAYCSTGSTHAQVICGPGV